MSPIRRRGGDAGRPCSGARHDGVRVLQAPRRSTMMTNSAQAVPLTESSVAWLRQELDRLRQEREPALVERLREIQQEAGFHDLQAHVVRDELTRVRERIHELEITLETATAPDGRHAPDVITIGSRVIVR